MKVEQSTEARLTGAQQLLNDPSDERFRDEVATKGTTATLETMVPDAYVNHIRVLTGGVGRDQLNEFYSKHFIPKMPSDTEIVSISRTIGSERLVDDERLSTEEAASDSGTETLAQPSSSVNEDLDLDEEIRSETGLEGIVGQSAALRQVLQLVKTVAPRDSTVLLLGETGTGKELIARAIHNHSRRKERNFVKLNCAAIPTGLLESELFGHERGAFTGAIAQKVGRLECADRGSLFMDEIGDIPLELQPKLLRLLQEREFERLGSSRTQRVDVRVVAATNRDLERMMAEKQFRSDLYYRLNVFPIEVPPLRERSEDILLLVRYFVQHYARRMNRAIETIASETMDALTHYSWPGNVRELQNLMERAVILSTSTVLRVPLRDLHTHTTPCQGSRNHGTLEDAERAHILATVKETKWVLSGPKGAATRLGLNRSTLQFRMKKLGIVRPLVCECQH